MCNKISLSALMLFAFSQNTLAQGTTPYVPGQTFIECRYCPEMIVLPAGNFLIGSPVDEPLRRNNEPQKLIRFEQPFAIAATPVTWDQWEACVRDRWCDGAAIEEALRLLPDGQQNPDYRDWGRGSRPVVGVSWYDAQHFVGWLNDKTGADDAYRLPSEAEWEYAARGGTTTAFPWGEALDYDYGNFGTDEEGLGGKAEGRDVWVNETSPVASFPPNDFGVYDMHGNIFEWTEDCYEADRAHTPTHGSANKEGNCANRVFRSGTFLSNPYMQRSARRGAPYPATLRGRNYLGFRVARSLHQEPAATCDRNCLIDIADRYLAAVAGRNPQAAPLADSFAFVENITVMEPGQGLWASATRLHENYRINVPDPVRGTIGVFTIVDHETHQGIRPALLAVRLRIDSGLISEAEHLIDAVPPTADAARLIAPRTALTRPVPQAHRMSRMQLAAIADSYYEALDHSDGTLAPFAADCERQENGIVTAAYYLEAAPFESVDRQGNAPPAIARDCIGQMSSGRFAYIDSIDNRRIFAIDPTHGLTMSLSHFRQSMTNGPHIMIAADGSEVLWDELRDPYDLPAAHILRISDGEIHEIEAIGIFVPYNSPTGWE
jgi:formylglycine-generating enzyme required for sulfatase activity